jgi:hypothetical protein
MKKLEVIRELAVSALIELPISEQRLLPQFGGI